LSQALMSAHETTYFDEMGFQMHGVLHGDLKPANVICTDTGEVKLLDFLLVDVQRLLDPRVVPSYLIEREEPATAGFGTPGFMAPEQESEGIVTVQTDIYGLGITLGCLFLRRPIIQIFDLVDENVVPDSLKRLLIRMMHPEPSKRPKGVREVYDHLTQINNE